MVSVDEIVRGLILGASQLYGSALAADAPPVFLLDSLRLSAGTPLQPGVYDNRWMVFPQDFPSANILLSKGISKVLVVRHERTELPSDLPHVLLRWQEAGLIVYSKDAMTSGPPTPLSIARPKWYRAAWQRALVMLRLRPNSAGGFGAVVPDPSSGYGIG
ncbi:MAG TPA: hypothetical protein VJZ71_08710 [Phycisphaerae bacterium]|nr:hypothetical protein [Phycisphaerae bacterium]